MPAASAANLKSVAITNQPIARFAEDLRSQGKWDEYLELLLSAFNPATVEGLMCRSTLSVDYRGQLYDCDFNQMLGMVWRNGKSLYLFEADSGTQSTCSGACAQAWPPLTTNGAPKAASTASPSLLGTTARSDGTTQVTYSGHPLYHFAGDNKPGDTNGEGSTAFGAGWDVLSPTGGKIEAQASGSY